MERIINVRYWKDYTTECLRGVVTYCIDSKAIGEESSWITIDFITTKYQKVPLSTNAFPPLSIAGPWILFARVRPPSGVRRHVHHRPRPALWRTTHAFQTDFHGTQMYLESTCRLLAEQWGKYSTAVDQWCLVFVCFVLSCWLRGEGVSLRGLKGFSTLLDIFHRCFQGLFRPQVPCTPSVQLTMYQHIDV